MAGFGSSLPLRSEVGLQILLAAGSSSAVVRAASLVVGVGMPVVTTCRALEGGSSTDKNRCLAYWSAYGCYRMVEPFADGLISWVPFYYHAKLAFLVWLQLPSPFTGAEQLYTRHIRPLFLRFRPQLEAIWQRAQNLMSGWQRMQAEDAQAAAEIARQAARTALRAIDALTAEVSGSAGSSVSGTPGRGGAAITMSQQQAPAHTRSHTAHAQPQASPGLSSMPAPQQARQQAVQGMGEGTSSSQAVGGEGGNGSSEGMGEWELFGRGEAGEGVRRRHPQQQAGGAGGEGRGGSGDRFGGGDVSSSWIDVGSTDGHGHNGSR